MNKNSIAIIAGVVGIVVLLGGLVYLGGRSAPSASPGAAGDPHGHNTAANASLAALNDFINKPAPAFSFTARDGAAYSSDTLRGKNILLFFNEGLMCYPACWNQIVAFARDDRFTSGKTVVLSVVTDSPQEWQKAVDKMPELAQATVVFDAGAAASKKFGVLSTPSSMHPGTFPGHTYVVIDAEGIVRYVFDDPAMGIRNDQLAEEIAKLP